MVNEYISQVQLPNNETYNIRDKELIPRLKATVGHSGKNVFEITAETGTSRGVTFTVDKQAGTVTTSGTATGGSAIFYMQISADVKGDFYYSGCAEGGTSSTYYIDTYDKDTGVKLKSWDGTTPTSNCYYLTQSRQLQIPQGHNNCSLRIVIARNVNANGLVFKPMIRDPRIADDEPEPYVTPTDKKKQDKLVVCYQQSESQATARTVISSENNRYQQFIVTCLLGSSNATTFNVDADFIGKTWLINSDCVLQTTTSSDNIAFALGVSPSYNPGKIVKIIGIPK